MKNFLVIGASGFVGRHIYSFLKQNGYNSLGTRFSSTDASLIEFDIMTDKILDVIPSEFYCNDQAKVAIICSAICKIDKCFEDVDKSYNLNVVKTKELIKHLKIAGFKVIFMSTESVHDGEVGYYDEKSKASPINEYGKQKVEMENYILSNTDDGLIYRLGFIVGDDPLEMHLFSQWYKKAGKGDCIECIEGQIFSPTYVRDIPKIIVKSVDKNLSGLYNLANQEFFSRDELARQFFSALNLNVEIVAKDQSEFGFSEKRSLKTYLDGSRLRNEIDINYTPMRVVFERFISRLGETANDR